MAKAKPNGKANGKAPQRQQKRTLLDVVADQLGVSADALREACNLLIAREPLAAEAAQQEPDDERALGLCPRARCSPGGFLVMRQSGVFAVCHQHQLRWSVDQAAGMGL
jgi:hypothetical protein